ncbi:MAG: PBP1A family penicillin-binding protein [Pseudomonadota bacterium]
MKPKQTDPLERASANRRRGWLSRTMLAADSWLDTTIYQAFASGGDFWEDVVIFFRQFRVFGFKRVVTEIGSEAATIGLVGATLLFALAIPAMERTEGDWLAQDEFSVTFLDRFGNEIGERGIRQRPVAQLEDLPDHFVKAVLATEDRRFFDHYGVDPQGLIRALYENARANAVVQGGSTITQQLAKNVFLTNERSLERKINEAFLSVWLEFNLTKKEILQLYLDRAYMGGGNFGVQAAAEFYFGKSVKSLTMAEGAMLAGLFKAPTAFAPHVNLPNARARANEVLTNMVEADFVTEGQVVEARRRPAAAIYRGDLTLPDYFLDWAFDEVREIALGLGVKNLVAKTTIDLNLQKAAENSVESHLRQYGKSYGVKQAAMVVMDTEGAVRAVVGGRDYGQSQYNRATRAKRQPGSSFKPFVYAHAMENGLRPESRVLDAPIRIGNWSPQNYGRSFRGRTTAATALIKSINTVPVRLSSKRSFREEVVKLTKRMGVEANIVPFPPMALGVNEMTVLDQATGYSVFANGGFEPRRHGITQLRSEDGSLVWDFESNTPPAERVLSEEAVASMNQILVQVPQIGTARRAALAGIPAAGKTGTTQAYRDAWFVGYTGNYVAAVWYGNDDFSATARLTGGRLPAMTWQQFMTYAHQNIELESIPFIGEQNLPTPFARNEGFEISERPRGLSAGTERALRSLNNLFVETIARVDPQQLADISSGITTNDAPAPETMISRP